MAIVYRFYRAGDMFPGPIYTTNEKEAAMAAMQGHPVTMISGEWYPMKATWNLSVDHSGVK